MPIKYALFKNNITVDPGDYPAIVQITGTAVSDDLVQHIIDQVTTLNRLDILAVTAALKLACRRRAVRSGIVDCGFRIDDRCEPRGCRGAGSAIRNRQFAIDMVRARMGTDTADRELRIGRLDTALTVPPS